MKKIIKVCALIFVVVLLFTMVGCKKKNPPKEPVIESIQVVEGSIPSQVYIDEVNSKLANIKIKVLKSDDNEETISLTSSMVSASDLSKLSTEGTHTIKVTYEGFETTFTIKVVAKDVGGDDPVDQEVEYKVFIKDIAGKPLADFYVMFYKGDEVVEEGYSNIEGCFSIKLKPYNYDVVIEAREGYYLNQEMYETDLIGSEITVEAEIDSLAGKEADIFTSYKLGDVMYDFTLTDINGKELTLYELLETKRAVFLNFWYNGCSWCETEFPDIIAAYESTYVTENGEERNYKDDIAVIAVNPMIVAAERNTLDDIKNYAKLMGITFNVATDLDGDSGNLTFEPLLTTMFGVTGYPTTVIIDSFGLIAEIESGAVIGTVSSLCTGL